MSKPKTPCQVRSSKRLADVERESRFYRRTLEQICQDKRKTSARRLAESALTFWDAITAEAAKRRKAKAANNNVSESPTSQEKI